MSEEKVYCTFCKYLRFNVTMDTHECKSDNALIERDTWLEVETYRADPEILNKENFCPFFEAKK